jgi:hypothetical protein
MCLFDNNVLAKVPGVASRKVHRQPDVRSMWQNTSAARANNFSAAATPLFTHSSRTVPAGQASRGLCYDFRLWKSIN